MTDELTPEQEADISRLLAEARHDGPIPADVAARLDAVLGDLSSDDLEVFENPTATVHELAGARRRRQKGARLLMAAAAVVVAGVAAGQVLGDTNLGSGSDDAATSADAGAEADQPADRDDAGGDSAISPEEESEPSAPSPASEACRRPGLPLPVRRAAAVHEQGLRGPGRRPAAGRHGPDGGRRERPRRHQAVRRVLLREGRLRRRRQAAGVLRRAGGGPGAAASQRRHPARRPARLRHRVRPGLGRPACAALTGIFLAYDRFNRLVNEENDTHV